jgi:glycosyltransferase involved in cell wall biosynthesis
LNREGISSSESGSLAAQQRLPVSVCMISGAEAHRIEKTLESVRGWAAEIVIVLNNEVKDDTAAIAQNHGARVFREPWKGFIGQKNSAAEKCSQPWLLNLDADEVVTPTLAAEIRRVVVSGAAAFAAYEFPRCTFYCGRWIRHGDWYPDRVCRLWRRGAAKWEGQEPHARLEVSGRIGRLRSDLLHFSHENIACHIAKIAPYQFDAAKSRHLSGKGAGFSQLVGRPFWRFFRAYFVRLGFLDGWQGFYIACLTSFATLTRFAMVREAEEQTRDLP